jgi:hypothetical protein
MTPDVNVDLGKVNGDDTDVNVDLGKVNGDVACHER